MATTQDKDEKESPKKKGGKDLDDLKKEVPIVSSLRLLALIFMSLLTCLSLNLIIQRMKLNSDRDSSLTPNVKVPLQQRAVRLWSYQRPALIIVAAVPL